MFGTPRRFRRILAGGASLGVLVSTAVAFSPFTGFASAAIPANYTVVVDVGGVNDENGSSQLELTQMGRDDTDATFYQIFWSWDSTDFTAQTGDACALFDSDAEGNITFNIC